METTMTPFIWTVPSREVTVKGVSLKTKGQRRAKTEAVSPAYRATVELITVLVRDPLDDDGGLLSSKHLRKSWVQG